MNDKGLVVSTLVHTEEGLVSIKDIKVGDMALSRDQHNAEGELVYKPVLRTIVTEDVPVFFATFTPESVDDLPFEQLTNHNLYVDLLCTANHPFWVRGIGWKTAAELSRGNTTVLKNNESAFFEGGSEEGGIEVVFKTDKNAVGFIPNFYDQSNNGRFVNLETGRTLSFGGYDPVFNKLFVEDNNWKQRLLEQTPTELRDTAEFYNFRTGFWQDDVGIDWAEGEGPVTTTEYNIEVAETHTYFIGEQGLWVYDSKLNIKPS